jgi:hypothetical protein
MAVYDPKEATGKLSFSAKSTRHNVGYKDQIIYVCYTFVFYVNIHFSVED